MYVLTEKQELFMFCVLCRQGVTSVPICEQLQTCAQSCAYDGEAGPPDSSDLTLANGSSKDQRFSSPLTPESSKLYECRMGFMLPTSKHADMLRARPASAPAVTSTVQWVNHSNGQTRTNHEDSGIHDKHQYTALAASAAALDVDAWCACHVQLTVVSPVHRSMVCAEYVQMQQVENKIQESAWS